MFKNKEEVLYKGTEPVFFVGEHPTLPDKVYVYNPKNSVKIMLVDKMSVGQIRTRRIKQWFNYYDGDSLVRFYPTKNKALEQADTKISSYVGTFFTIMRVTKYVKYEIVGAACTR